MAKHLLHGANIDVDLSSPAAKRDARQDRCPWNAAEETQSHKCAIKSTVLCKYFRGIQPPDVVVCYYQEDR